MKRERVRRSGTMAAIASFALVVLVACGRGTPEEAHEVTRVPVMSEAAAQATKAAETGATPGAGSETAAAAVEVTIDSYDIYFEPKDVTIPANTDVKIVLPNLGAAAHNFSIEALDVSVDIAPGDTKEVVINAPAGEYEFVCNVPGHKEAGMVGTLIVSEDAAAAPAAAEATPAAEAAAAATPAEPAEATQEAAPAAAPEAAPAAEAGPVTVVSHDIFFEPKEISIPANTDVTFNLPNEGVTLHNFAIDALGVDVDIAPGETQEVVINAPAGTYEIYCNVPGHKAAGMVATLTVEEGAAAPAAQEAAPAAEEAAPAEAATAETPAEEATPAAETEAAAEPQAAAPAAAGPVEVVSYDIYFEPKEITIPANTDVTFSLPNEGVTLHNFAIDALGVDVDIAPGEIQEVVINAPAGTYEIYCNVPGHKAAGMVATLTVEEGAAAPAEAAAPAAAEATPAAAAQEASPAAEDSATAEAVTAGPVDLIADDIFFSPEAVSIPADTDVTFNLKNDGVAAHTFTIDALDIAVPLPPGESAEVVINAPAGEYEYYCTEPGHKDIGMRGTLTVVAPGAAAAAPAEAAQAASPEASPAAAEETAATPAAEAAAQAAEAVEVVSYDIYFEPKELAIPADTDVTVQLPNEGVTLHNFAIDALDIDVDIAPGETQEVVINAPAGEYEYYCNVPGHKAAGMVGTLTVG